MHVYDVHIVTQNHLCIALFDMPLIIISLVPSIAYHIVNITARSEGEYWKQTLSFWDDYTLRHCQLAFLLWCRKPPPPRVCLPP